MANDVYDDDMEVNRVPFDEDIHWIEEEDLADLWDDD